MTWLADNLSLIAGLFGSVGAIGGGIWGFRRKVWPGFRQWLLRVLRYELLERIAEDLGEVKAELKFNGGGSVKDKVVRMSNFLDNEFWLRPQPVFMCYDDGTNAQVSEAYCHLVGVRSLEELRAMNWRIFVVAEDLPGYDELWERALEHKQGVVATARFQTQLQEPRGRWRIRVVPVSAEGGRPDGRFLFAGYFSPADEVARTIWEDNEWQR